MAWNLCVFKIANKNLYCLLLGHTLGALSVLCNKTSVPFNSLPLTSIYWYFLLRPFYSFLLFKFVTGFCFTILESTGFQKLNWISLTVRPGIPTPGGPMSPGEPWTPGSPLSPWKWGASVSAVPKGCKLYGCIILLNISLKIVYDLFIPLVHGAQVLQDFHLIPKRIKKVHTFLFLKRLITFKKSLTQKICYCSSSFLNNPFSIK